MPNNPIGIKLARNIKSQSSVEFVLLISFMFLVFLVFFAIAGDKIVKLQKEKDRRIAENFLSLVKEEITLAVAVQDGYYREISIPPTIDGYPYELVLLGDRELVINYSNYEYVQFLPGNVRGNLSRGINTINKINGTVYLNFVGCPLCPPPPPICNGDGVCDLARGENCINCNGDCPSATYCPAGLVCDVRSSINCTSPWVIVMQISDFTDAHSALPGYGNFDYVVCCAGDVSKGVVVQNDCDNDKQNRIFRLYNTTDSHVKEESNSEPITSLDVCLRKTAGSGNLNCNSWDDDSCPIGNNEACMVAFSGTDVSGKVIDAHIGSCSLFNSTSRSLICCKVT